MKTKPQGQLENTWLGHVLKHPLAVILSNWVFQGMRYMGVYEVIIKLFLDLVLALIIFSLLDGLPVWLGAFISLVLAHTLNWIFNGHIFVLMRYVCPVPKSEEQFEKYVQFLKEFAEKHRSIDCVVVYGSYCRGQLHKFSDLDARVLTMPGMVNGICGALLCVYLRFRAFFQTFPLDIYCYRNLAFLSGLSESEKPVMLIDRTSRLTDVYSKDKV